MRKITFAQALNEALHEEMMRDEKVFIYGQDVAVVGGLWKVTTGLLDKFGPDRVKDTPLSEAAMAGMAVGAAITGTRPIVEIMFADFLAVCFDEVYNKAAKWRYVHGGMFEVPLVIRSSMGATFGGSAEHAQCNEALFMHTPGIKIVLPSTPYDAKGLLKTAIRDNNPVLFFEHRALYNTKGEVPEEEYTIPFGKAEIKKQGEDITVVATSRMVSRSLSAAEDLKKEGINIEVIDPKTIVPLDIEAINQSVKKTGHLVIVEEGNRTGGVGAEITALVQENVFDFLKKPILRISSLDVPIPFNDNLKNMVIPSTTKIVEEIKTLIKK
ncbi:MAG: alpha-ketoacid dehydrogenase subunit beta [Candidatus Atribacteria bacterium]|jgi:pyruvate/2-oxoglutarate/acetoin dehydrogenase E1 component|nr:alpha-ketoacid dehydrogenase subunit beta [Candidatus Atribacteria bacterium]